MRLQIMTPTTILVDTTASKVVAAAPNGSFCLLPRHIDFVSALSTGILSFTGPDESESFVAVDEGILVKAADRVYVSVTRAVAGGDLGSLRETVRYQFEQLDEQERRARSALARLEADFVRRLIDITEPEL